MNSSRPLIPNLIPLDRALKKIDAFFGTDSILSAEGEDNVARYYRLSRVAYHRVISKQGAMHHRLGENGLLGQAREVEAVIKQIGAKDVVEMGCGLGYNARALAHWLPQVNFTGVDLQADHIRRAKRLAEGLANLRFLEGNHASLPLPDASCDVIFAVETLCHTEMPFETAAEIFRVLRPGGVFIMFDAHRRPERQVSPDVQLATRIYEVGTAVCGGFISRDTWVQAFDRAGMRDLVFDDVGPMMLPHAAELHLRAIKHITTVPRRWILKLLPKVMSRNVAAGIAGPYACAGAGPDWDLSAGAVSYDKVTARRPE